MLSMLVIRVISPLWVKAARRPYVAAVIATMAAIAISVVWFLGGETLAERGAPIMPFVAFLIAATLVGAGLYVKDLEAKRHAMSLRSAITPPSPFVTKPNFWLGFVAALVFLPVTVGFLGTLDVEEGRSVAEGTIVDERYAPNEFGKPFYDVVVEFETVDGAVVRGQTNQYGSATVGESLRVQYLLTDPTDIREYDLKNQLGLVAMFGGMALIALATAVYNRPRHVLREIPAPSIDGLRPWSQQTSNGQSGLMHELHFFAGDVNKIWVWKTGERTQQGLADWMASGGSLQPGTYAHWKFDVETVHEVALKGGQLSIVKGPEGSRKVTHFEVGRAGNEVLAKLEHNYGWTVVPQVPTSTGVGLGRFFAKKSAEPGWVARPADQTYAASPATA